MRSGAGGARGASSTLPLPLADALPAPHYRRQRTPPLDLCLDPPQLRPEELRDPDGQLRRARRVRLRGRPDPASELVTDVRPQQCERLPALRSGLVRHARWTPGRFLPRLPVRPRVKGLFDRHTLSAPFEGRAWYSASSMAAM